MDKSIGYAKCFYLLYIQQIQILPQLVERLYFDIFSIPLWRTTKYTAKSL